METVVDEKPLSFATSRIVTIEPLRVELRKNYFPEDQPAHSRPLEFMPPLADTTAECETSVKQGELFLFVFLIVLAARAMTQPAPLQQPPSVKPRGTQSGTAPQNADPQQLFQQGEAALKKGDL